MSQDDWNTADGQDLHAMSIGDKWRIFRRGVPLAIVTFGCLIILLLMRLIERPIFGAQRPLTPFITQFVCRTAFLIMGIPFERRGTPMSGKGAGVANHASWLDIFTLNACDRIYFISKSEVASWPAIGWLARATGTLFIERKREKAAEHTKMVEDRLHMGHRLLFFPEGTSSDGIRVLPFKPTLFQSFLAEGLPNELKIQPITVNYIAPKGEDPRFYGYWGEMSFGTALFRTLSVKKQGNVQVIYHPPVQVSDFANRKEIALQLEVTVRNGHFTTDLG